MAITSALVLYAVIWFMVLFITLPLRLKTQGDVGEITPGTQAGAPAELNLKRKFRIVTAIAFVLWDFGWMHPFVSERVAGFLDAFSLHPRYGAFSEGIVSLANIVYFASLALVAFAVARFSFDLRRVG